MATFPLKVLTSEKEFFSGEVERIVVRTTSGDVGILHGHVPYTAALGIGMLLITQEGKQRAAAVAGGFVDVSKEQTVVLARSCEWADEIDVSRAKQAMERAKEKLKQEVSRHEMDTAQVKLKRAINRIRIAQR